ncbi:HisA/HisF-related TIM barrel protein [Methylocystis sp. MJC1]|jgi:phosphoribosylformimino-5-aminoimidazole carboxamide ribotide isomerase|uniref:HisA/HisF-related TIM barrel protein n=1 Tax=Methylocystis sp. MJC1 TaxID=2654282 RepID=UPI0013ED90E6|nr:HisA/HisF-related TIM barrel protein [Methylocystis sp. MJC1]KAF2989720.1 1-(5-phosphoribosyl)-5-[(5-phosphoribosylamino)methylideneamino] imidazole-4-carboxamide isomerase [Methylocystis sp. MJC1]MBU6525571.1 nickel transporter [Methylocystis sp. MJC1]UZX12051.1 HisA/HisF-related TIM barrel protein [Methylocystis sp. MJC1]
MQVIPVIDIRNGVVVRAVAGQRSEYKPLETPLAPTGAPLDVAHGLASLHPFRTLYIADLDAIEGRSDNYAHIIRVATAFPHARLWVDVGITRFADADRWLALRNIDVVIGSESLKEAAELRAIRDNSRFALSLDFSAQAFLGEAEILHNAGLWPANIIVMTLARVGAGQGPDLSRLNEILPRAKGKNVYAAGGVRGVEDLIALEKAGVAGALIATALHDGRLTRKELGQFHAE